MTARQRDPIEAWGEVSARAARAGGAPDMRTERRQGPATAAGLGVLTLAVVVIGAAIVLRPAVGPAADVPVTATVDDGMFRLDLTTPGSSYTTVDEIDPVVSLTYLGPDPVRTIYYAVHPSSFRVEEIGGTRTMGGGGDQPCNHTTLMQDNALAQSFSKAGSPTDDPLLGFDRAWYEDPVLRLPAGHWRIVVELAITVDGCGGPRHDLTAANEITVTQAVARPDPVVSRADDGMFRLEMTTPRGIYGPGEPIEPVATLTYVGPGPEQTMYHGTSPIVFSIDEIGGTRTMLGGMGPSCGSSVIRKDTPLTYPFAKSGSMDAFFDRAWWDDPVLRLPLGTWRIRVSLFVSVSGGTDPCGGISHDLVVDNIVELVGPAPSASLAPSGPPATAIPASPSPSATPLPTIGPSYPTPSEGPVSDVIDDGVFRLELTTPSGIYGPNDPIEPIARLGYVGVEGSVTYGHGDPAVGFRIEEIGGDRQMTGGVADVCMSTTRQSGQPLTLPFQKGGQIGLGFDEVWFHDPVLKLPPGTWRITARLEAYIPECGLDADIREPTVQNVIRVVSLP